MYMCCSERYPTGSLLGTIFPVTNLNSLYNLLPLSFYFMVLVGGGHHDSEAMHKEKVNQIIQYDYTHVIEYFFFLLLVVDFFLVNIFDLYFIIVKCANIANLFTNILNYFLLLNNDFYGLKYQDKLN